MKLSDFLQESVSVGRVENYKNSKYKLNSIFFILIFPLKITWFNRRICITYMKLKPLIYTLNYLPIILWRTKKAVPHCSETAFNKMV